MTFLYHVCTFVVMFLIGMVLVVVENNFSGKPEDRTMMSRPQVLTMSLSYCILLLLTLRGVYIGIFTTPIYPLSELAAYALVSAYVLGAYALTGIMRDVRKKSEVRKDNVRQT